MSAFDELAGRLSLQGRSAVVTGGGGGIGSMIASHLRAAGAAVASIDLADHRPPDGIEHIAADLGDAHDLARVATRLRERQPVADVLVHCAGITRDGVLWKLEDSDWSAVMRVNLDPAFYLLRALAPGMRSRSRGSVVFISSINAERGKLGQTNYAASKAGLIGLAKSAAKELGRFDVRVNVVAPGYIETRMTAGLPEDVRRAAIAETALGRPGAPVDVANAVLYLCSDLSSHVTGQVLRVDGGQCTA